MRVLHVITNLEYGGAETMLQRLVQAFDPAEVTQEVVALRSVGGVGRRIAEAGLRTHALGMRRFPGARELVRLVRVIRAFEPDVVQTWLYHADLLGGLAAKLGGGGARVFWGVHNSTLDPATTHRTTRWTVAACARLSHRVPDVIVSVSRTARDLHVAAGYDASKFVVVPNGFDVGRFRPDPARRAEVRAELGLGPAAVVVGLVARVDPQKDHATFVRAAALLARRRPEVRFLLCGQGADARNPDLAAAIREAGLEGRFLLLGPRDDVPRIMSAIDVGTLSSAYGEAFPLAIGELMACGTPCVVTDLGDCAHLVGDTGRVVPPRDPEALSLAWEALVSLGEDGRRRLGLAARERISTHFGLARVAEQYAALYRRALGARRDASRQASEPAR